MIAERRGGGPPDCNVDFHAVFYFEKKRFIKGEGGGRLKDPPPLERPCFVAQFALHMPNAHASVSNRPCGYKNLFL